MIGFVFAVCLTAVFVAVGGGCAAFASRGRPLLAVGFFIVSVSLIATALSAVTA